MNILLVYFVAKLFIYQASAYAIDDCEAPYDDVEIAEHNANFVPEPQESKNFEIIISNTGIYINGDLDVMIDNRKDKVDAGKDEDDIIVVVEAAVNVADNDIDVAGANASDETNVCPDVDESPIVVEAGTNGADNGLEVVDTDASVDANIINVAVNGISVTIDKGEVGDSDMDKVPASGSIAFGGPVKAHGTVSIIGRFPGSAISSSSSLSAADPETTSISEPITPFHSDTVSTVTTYYVPTVVFPNVFYYPVLLRSFLPIMSYRPLVLPNMMNVDSEDDHHRAVESKAKGVPFSGIVPASGSVTIVGKF